MNRPAMYQRPNKPLRIEVKKRRAPEEREATPLPEPITVDRATECHATPDDVARRMVEYLGPQGDYKTLEPSAGTGQLVRALLASGHSSCELVMVERHIALAQGVRKYGPTVNQCFLEFAAEARGRAAFPRVIMNPPFSKVRQHVKAALDLLHPCGHDKATLVALVPVTFEHAEAETLETLPENTFALAKVRTKIIRIERESF